MNIENIAFKKLKEAQRRVQLFGLDYDGTISDGDKYRLPEALDLIEKILEKNKSASIVTARAASALKSLVPSIVSLMKENDLNNPVFIAGGNGTMLYEIKKGGLRGIYSHGFNLLQIIYAVKVGKKVYEKLGIKREDLALNGLETFQKFLGKNWEGYIPAEIINVSRSARGEFFTEEAKVTFVLPKDKSLHEKVVAELNKELDEEFCAAAGDETYVHITRKMEEDSKAVAIKTILKIMGLKPEEVVTFGDMPHGNDRGLLSFPFSFTNAEEFAKIKDNLELPPYILTGSDITPVARVYEAIEHLLS